jgi:hypothetical protein
MVFLERRKVRRYYISMQTYHVVVVVVVVVVVSQSLPDLCSSVCPLTLEHNAGPGLRMEKGLGYDDKF